ncbi:hypothetical protein [Streptomyces sp. NPDC048106]|uniref:hypothetical protein n=1 Tax=Streptomyces sp. NPDC048106 TaxID=3155750 RepID=UPI003451570B
MIPADAFGGKGGTMHLTTLEQGVTLTTGVVGSGVPVAVGPLAPRQQGSDRVVSVSEGMNFATV